MYSTLCGSVYWKLKCTSRLASEKFFCLLDDENAKKNSVFNRKPLGRGVYRGAKWRLGELHAGDESVRDGYFFGEGDDRGFDGEVFEAVAGAALEDEVAEGEEFIFVLGVAAAGYEVGEDDDVIGEVVVAVAVFPDFELDVDVASEVAEGCAEAVPIADCIIVAGSVVLGDVDAELPTAISAALGIAGASSALPSLAREVIKQVFDAVSCDCRGGFVGVGCCHFFEFWGCVLSSLIFSSRRCFWSRARAVSCTLSS